MKKIIGRIVYWLVIACALLVGIANLFVQTFWQGIATAGAIFFTVACFAFIMRPKNTKKVG